MLGPAVPLTADQREMLNAPPHQHTHSGNRPSGSVLATATPIPAGGSGHHR
jgi:hypothetical protein